MTRQKVYKSYHITRPVDLQGARPSVGCQAGVEKNTTGKKVDNNSRLLKYKKASLVSTLNCRTLSSQKNIGELIASAEKHGIDIVCIQEHRIFHDDTDIKHDMKNKWVLLTSLAEKALNNTTIRGVGMLLSPKAYKSLNSVETISPRIMIASFNGNPAVTIISCFSPTNVSDEEDKDEFYTEPTTITRPIPKHNILLVGGEMNTRIEKMDVMGFVYNDTTK